MTSAWKVKRINFGDCGPQRAPGVLRNFRLF